MHYYHRQQTAREMLMDREPTTFSLAECVGGPLDGRRFCQPDDDPVWFEAAPWMRYDIAGARYRPDRVENGILYLVYVPCVRRGVAT